MLPPDAQLRSFPVNILGLARVFRLRWVFEFHGDRAPRRGMWDIAGNRPCDMAAYVNKTGLAWAVIEGEHLGSQEIVRIVEAPAHLFEAFQWLAGARLPGAGLGSGEVTPHAGNVGLAILTTSQRIEVLTSGEVTVTTRTPDGIIIGNP